MKTEPILTLDILKDIYECIQASKYKDAIKVEYLGIEGEIPGFKVLSNRRLSFKESEEIMDIIYDCIDKYNPDLVIHFEWEEL